MASFTGLGSPTKALRLITSQTGGRTSHPKEKGETNPANPATKHPSAQLFCALEPCRRRMHDRLNPGSC